MTISRVVVLCGPDDEQVAAVERTLPPTVELLRLDLVKMLRNGFELSGGLGRGVKLMVANSNNGDIVEVPARDMVCWYRKPDLHILYREDREPWENSYLEEELRALVYGLAASFGEARWINGPRQSAEAGDRVRQLVVAEGLGHHVPLWSVTNRAWGLPKVENLVVKRLSTRRLKLPSTLRIYTSPFNADVDALSFDFLDGPNLVVERISVVAEVRVVAVADRLFGFGLQRSSDAADYRMDEDDQGWQCWDLPEPLARRLLRTVLALNLDLAAFDLAWDGEKYWFLEVNPNGEYAWLDRLVDGGITAAVAELLVGDLPVSCDDPR